MKFDNISNKDLDNTCGSEDVPQSLKMSVLITSVYDGEDCVELIRDGQAFYKVY